MYIGLSNIQKIKYQQVCGYEYSGNELSGKILTDRPYDKKWNLSPWYFSFIFQQYTGFLFCELDHRMTNNRTFGWDYHGNDIDSKLIDTIYPPHL